MPLISHELPSEGWYQELTIKFQDGTKKTFFLHFTRSGRYVPEQQHDPGSWTKLEFHKCPSCPLSEKTKLCPAAHSMENTLMKLHGHTSVEMVRARAIDGSERMLEVNWPLQQVGSVLVQLAVFSSGCPIGDQMRQYVLDLRPFATMSELTRHIVGKLLLKNRGAVEGSMIQIKQQLEPLNEVFTHLSKRLNSQTGSMEGGDAIANSVARVDAFARLLSMQIEQVVAQIGGELGWTPVPASAAPATGVWTRLKGLLGLK